MVDVIAYATKQTRNKTLKSLNLILGIHVRVAQKKKKGIHVRSGWLKKAARELKIQFVNDKS